MASAQNPNAKNYAFLNGNWFDGRKFEKKVFYSVGGVFSTKKPLKIDETVDLQNGFVIPPFADAHTHNLDGMYNLETLLEIATRVTPQIILPNRKIGRPAKGYEASFISLECNPIERFECVKKIQTRFKQGFLMSSHPGNAYSPG